MLQFLAVFSALFVLDFVWAKYTRAIAGGDRLKSSICASGIIVLSGSAAIGYVENPWMLIPAALGAFSGTFASMSFLTKEVGQSLDYADVAKVFEMICIRRHRCGIDDEPCNGLPRHSEMTPIQAEAYNARL